MNAEQRMHHLHSAGRHFHLVHELSARNRKPLGGDEDDLSFTGNWREKKTSILFVTDRYLATTSRVTLLYKQDLAEVAGCLIVTMTQTRGFILCRCWQSDQCSRGAAVCSTGLQFACCYDGEGYIILRSIPGSGWQRRCFLAKTLTSSSAVFVREDWAAICLLKQPEALMISSGSGVDCALTRNDLTPVVSPPSLHPTAPFTAVAAKHLEFRSFQIEDKSLF